MSEVQRKGQTSEYGTKDVEYIKSKIGVHSDFPKPGIEFKDIFPVLRDPKGLEMIITRMVHIIQNKYGDSIRAIVGLDSRGFLLGPIMALRLKCSFIPIRKKGKLPGQCISQSFEKEYGLDAMEIQNDGFIKPGDKVIMIDDLLATGGTLEAAYKLLTRPEIEANVVEAMVAIELNYLNGRERLQKIGLKNVYSVVQYSKPHTLSKL